VNKADFGKEKGKNSLMWLVFWEIRQIFERFGSVTNLFNFECEIK